MFSVVHVMDIKLENMRTPIRDNRSRPIGYIDNNSRLFDKTGGKLIATYNKATNSTYGANGNLIGKGNLLLTKIK